MIVKIYSLKKGLEVLEAVKAIRIKSDTYNLLILKDYLPIIGEIRGSFEVETETNTLSMEQVQAYYVNQNNIFEIIIKEE